MADRDWTTADYVIIDHDVYAECGGDWHEMTHGEPFVPGVLEDLAAIAGVPIVPARLITEDDFAATIRQAEIAAVRTYADQLGVYVGDEDSEFYRGYRQAQREAIQRAERYLAQLAAGGDHHG